MAKDPHAKQIKALQASGVRRLAITTVNHAGQTLVKSVPLARLAEAVSEGVGLSPVSDAFLVDGSIDPAHRLARPDGDLRLVAEANRLALLDGPAGWAWAPGNRHDRQGQPYPGDQRSFCQQQLAILQTHQLELLAGFEIEWVLGSPTGEGIAGGPYGADRLIQGLDYLSSLGDALDAAGIGWLQLHPEYGPSQFELSLAPLDPLAAADQLVLAKLVILRVSQRFGWRCSFSPVVDPALVGNGGHLHISARLRGEPLFAGAPEFSAAGAGVVAALLAELPALLPLACPLAVSYQRLAPSHWSAPYQAWGLENRETALRLIPSGLRQAGVIAQANLELKVADLAANPYLLLGGVMAVIADGLNKPRSLPPPVQGDPSRLPAEEQPPRLAANLEQAAAAFAQSALLRQAMGAELHGSYGDSLQAEIRRAAGLSQEQLVASTRWLPEANQPKRPVSAET